MQVPPEGVRGGEDPVGADAALLALHRALRHGRGQVSRLLHYYPSIHDVYAPSTLSYLCSFWRGIWTLMTRDIGLGPAQLLVILAMSLVLVIVMRWVVSLARKWYSNLNTSFNEGLLDSVNLSSSLPPQQQRC